MVGIKDFGMPSCCNNCEMSSCKGWGNFYCDITLEEIDMDSDKRDKDCPLVEAIPKADYEARLKADMVAMLTDIQISVAELDFSWMCDYADGDCIKRYAVVDIIQEKINALKGDQQQDEKIDTSKSDQGKVY